MTYIMFLGLNDQNAKIQLVSTEDAKKTVSDYCAHELGFATISEASGVYTHENGTTVQETTLQIKVSGCSEEQIREAAKFFKATFNQESIGLLSIPYDIGLI